MKRTLQPRYADRARSGLRGMEVPSLCRKGEGQCRGRRNSRQQPPGLPGYGRWHVGTAMRSKLGKLSSPAQTRPSGKDPAGECITSGEGARVSDEAIVSRDPAGQHNPLASQGPLDGSVLGSDPAVLPLTGPRGSQPGTWASYKADRDGGMRALRFSLPDSAKIEVDFPFEAVLGKTRRTEF